MDVRIHKLERDVRRLKRYGIVVTVLLSLIGISAFRPTGHARFSEIDVERINVVQADGTLRLAIAVPERLPPPTFYGKEYPGIRGGNAPGMAGMIYFNDEGTEMGGFGWSGRETENGTPRAVGLLTFDHYNQNEAIGLGYSDLNGRRRAGLSILDQPHVSIQPLADTLLIIMQLPDGPEKDRRLRALREGQVERGEVGVTRLYAGRDGDQASVVLLSDPQGRPRLRIAVDSLGIPSIEFLDEAGDVTQRLPGGEE